MFEYYDFIRQLPYYLSMYAFTLNSIVYLTCGTFINLIISLLQAAFG